MGDQDKILHSFGLYHKILLENNKKDRKFKNKTALHHKNKIIKIKLTNKIILKQLLTLLKLPKIQKI